MERKHSQQQKPVNPVLKDELGREGEIQAENCKQSKQYVWKENAGMQPHGTYLKTSNLPCLKSKGTLKAAQEGRGQVMNGFHVTQRSKNVTGTKGWMTPVWANTNWEVGELQHLGLGEKKTILEQFILQPYLFNSSNQRKVRWK